MAQYIVSMVIFVVLSVLFFALSIDHESAGDTNQQYVTAGLAWLCAIAAGVTWFLILLHLFPDF